ncbi:DNA polymerase III subunit delta' HolB [Hippea maritima]|uniref:DNA polymerase III delta prime subunit HolB n=1 Tax=Hippea maritima (strain ATCC 700847 / DSM 10411 / MH2) TaxID=760142 RepID=F2LWP6_HIPMA|nr:DNA polymerase III subunit delta' HolB [Hippea maritima]AEA33024.1 DNA polymerase III delta prime subunit HolB [Hippea maritima DSM 10411]
MEKYLNYFSAFILENAQREDALKFIEGFGFDRIVEFDVLKIDDVRKMKESSQTNLDKKMCFLIGRIGFDAQNAILKLIEEPPPLNWFIFYEPTNLLDTIYSRCQVIRLNRETSYLDGLEMVLENKEALLEYLFGLNQKEDIIKGIEVLCRILIKKGRVEQAEKLFEYIKTLREFNLNRNVLLMNIFVSLME